MVKNNFRAVLTIFDKEKVLELRFDGLNKERTRLQAIPNVNYRHDVNCEEFITAFKTLLNAMKRYDNDITGRYLIGKMLGLVD